MAFYKYFWDLANSTTFGDHTVGSFDNNTETGGGDFKWVSNADNTLLNNIPGVRIKPTSSTNGYWLRVTNGPVSVDWFGPQNTATAPYTFSQLGVAQNTLNNRYGVNFVTTSDTYDTAAVKYAMYYMGSYATENSVQFEPKMYWLTQAIDLPKTNVSNPGLPGVGGQGKFIIDGNGCTITTYGTNAPFNVFQRIPVDQAEATTLVDYSFVFKNFSATSWGSSWVNSGYSFLFLGASSNAIIENINLVNYDIGIRLEYCPNATVRNIYTSGVKTRSVYIKSGSWLNATLTNSNSNNVAVYQMQVEDTNSQVAALSFAGVNNAVVSQFWLKGPGVPSYGIWWDSLNNTEAKNLRIMDTYLSVATSVAGIYTKMLADGLAIVDGLYNSAVQTVVSTEMYSGTGYMYFSNSTVWPTGSQMSNTGVVKWDFKAVNFGPGITTPTDIVNPLNNLWVTAGPPAIPSVSNVLNQPTGGAPQVSLQQVLDYNHDLANGVLFMGSLAGDSNTGTQEIIGIGTGASGFNSGDNIVGIGYLAANVNTGSDVVGIGNAAASTNTGSNVVCIGNAVGAGNDGNYVTAIGDNAANNNTGNSVIAIGTAAAQNNTGSNVLALGDGAAFGGGLSVATVISNSFLPSYVDHVAAVAAITAPGAGVTGTYLYHNQATDSIGAVRIP